MIDGISEDAYACGWYFCECFNCDSKYGGFHEKICLTARHTSQTVIMQLFKLVMLPMEIHCL